MLQRLPIPEKVESFIQQSKAECFYARLDVSLDASTEDIKKALRERAYLHPDRAPDNRKAEFTNAFKRVMEAFETLEDDPRRKLYDVMNNKTRVTEESVSGDAFYNQVFKDYGFPANWAQQNASAAPYSSAPASFRESGNKKDSPQDSVKGDSWFEEHKRENHLWFTKQGPYIGLNGEEAWKLKELRGKEINKKYGHNF